MSSQEQRQYLSTLGFLTYTNLYFSIDNKRTAYCAFWDHKVPDMVGGAWSSEGCDVQSTNETHTVCCCYHLTSFAIMMEPLVIPPTDWTLVTKMYMLYICTGVSMFALLIFCLIVLCNKYVLYVYLLMSWYFLLKFYQLQLWLLSYTLSYPNELGVVHSTQKTNKGAKLYVNSTYSSDQRCPTFRPRAACDPFRHFMRRISHWHSFCCNGCLTKLSAM